MRAGDALGYPRVAALGGKQPKRQRVALHFRVQAAPVEVALGERGDIQLAVAQAEAAARLVAVLHAEAVRLQEPLTGPAGEVGADEVHFAVPAVAQGAVQIQSRLHGGVAAVVPGEGEAVGSVQRFVHLAGERARENRGGGGALRLHPAKVQVKRSCAQHYAVGQLLVHVQRRLHGH